MFVFSLKYFTDCKSLKQANGSLVYGNYKIYPDGINAITVECDMPNGGLVIWAKRRSSDNFDFRKPWNAYLTSFGSLDTQNYWIGLNNLHLLTSKTSRVYFDIVFNGTWNGIQYKYFVVGNSSTQFRMEVSDKPFFVSLKDLHVPDPTSWFRNSGRGLSYHSGMPFSTYDVDNDMWSGGNVADKNGAWWMKDNNYVFGTFFALNQSMFLKTDTDTIRFDTLVLKIMRQND